MPEFIRNNNQLQSIRQELGQLSEDIASHRQDLHILLGRISIWEHSMCGPTAYSLDTALGDLHDETVAKRSA
jgi:hypothetical protein